MYTLNEVVVAVVLGFLKPPQATVNGVPGVEYPVGKAPVILMMVGVVCKVEMLSIVLAAPAIVTMQLLTLKPIRVTSSGNSIVKIPPIGIRFKGVMLKVYDDGE